MNPTRYIEEHVANVAGATSGEGPALFSSGFRAVAAFRFRVSRPSFLILRFLKCSTVFLMSFLPPLKLLLCSIKPNSTFASHLQWLDVGCLSVAVVVKLVVVIDAENPAQSRLTCYILEAPEVLYFVLGFMGARISRFYKLLLYVG